MGASAFCRMLASAVRDLQLPRLCEPRVKQVAARSKLSPPMVWWVVEVTLMRCALGKLSPAAYLRLKVKRTRSHW